MSVARQHEGFLHESNDWLTLLWIYQSSSLFASTVHTTIKKRNHTINHSIVGSVFFQFSSLPFDHFFLEKKHPPGCIDDAFYPTLGYLCGLKSPRFIPAVVGLETLKPTRDDLKAFSAAFGTSSSAAMFHLVGLTPEAVWREV